MDTPRPVTWRDFHCYTCWAQPGEACYLLADIGKQRRRRRPTKPHMVRVKLAERYAENRP